MKILKLAHQNFFSAPKLTALILSTLAASVLTPSQTRADTLARVFGIANQAMITVYLPKFGGSDADGSDLFDAMNVPIQESFLGPAKSIKNSAQTMSWVCGNRGPQDGHQCTIMVQKTSTSEIRGNPVKVRYEATGSEAAVLRASILPNTPEGDFKFTNQEGTLKIEATEQHFFISFDE